MSSLDQTPAHASCRVEEEKEEEEAPVPVCDARAPSEPPRRGPDAATEALIEMFGRVQASFVESVVAPLMARATPEVTMMACSWAATNLAPFRTQLNLVAAKQAEIPEGVRFKVGWDGRFAAVLDAEGGESEVPWAS